MIRASRVTEESNTTLAPSAVNSDTTLPCACGKTTQRQRQRRQQEAKPSAAHCGVAEQPREEVSDSRERRVRGGGPYLEGGHAEVRGEGRPGLRRERDDDAAGWVREAGAALRDGLVLEEDGLCGGDAAAARSGGRGERGKGLGNWAAVVKVNTGRMCPGGASLAAWNDGCVS